MGSAFIRLVCCPAYPGPAPSQPLLTDAVGLRPPSPQSPPRSAGAAPSASVAHPPPSPRRSRESLEQDQRADESSVLALRCSLPICARDLSAMKQPAPIREDAKATPTTPPPPQSEPGCEAQALRARAHLPRCRWTYRSATLRGATTHTAPVHACRGAHTRPRFHPRLLAHRFGRAFHSRGMSPNHAQANDAEAVFVKSKCSCGAAHQTRPATRLVWRRPNMVAGPTPAPWAVEAEVAGDGNVRAAHPPGEPVFSARVGGNDRVVSLLIHGCRALAGASRTCPRRFVKMRPSSSRVGTTTSAGCGFGT